MASRAMLVACLVMVTMCVASLSLVADDEARPSGAVSGVVAASGGATTTELELYRIGDYDPLIGIGNQIRRDPGTAANRLAVNWGVVAGSPMKVLSSDENGRFSLGSLETGGYVIWAKDAKGRLGSGAFRVYAEGTRQSVRVRMSSGAQSLHAIVSRRAGVPYEGPVVLLRCDQHGDKYRLGRCQTDAKGQLDVGWLPDGDLQLVIATTDGMAAMSPKYSLPSTPKVVWTLVADGATPIKGRVLATDDGSPIAGATVEVVKASRSGPFTSVTARTAADGRFLVQAPGRPDAIGAFATGFEKNYIRVGAAAEESELRLSRLHTLRGRVVKKGTTEGVAGARVMAYKSKLRGPRRFSVTTDDDGYFAFKELATSEWMIFAMGNGWICEGLWKIGWQTYNPFLVDVSDSSHADHVIEVMEAGVLEGKVVDETGAPIQGAQVIPALQSTPVSDERPLWAFATALRVVTGPDGTFHHNGLLPRGTYLFRVSILGRPTLESTRVIVKAGPKNEPLLIRFPAKRWLEVQVLDGETGKPVEGARVRPAIVKRWGASTLGWSRTTGADGTARLSPLPEGALALFVNADAYEHPQEEATQVPEVHVSQEGKPFVVRLARGEMVSGKVVLPEGVGPTGFKVGAYVLPPPHVHNDPVRTATLDDDGSFRIVGLRKHRYRIAAWRRVEGGEWWGAVTLEAPASDAVIELEFEPAEPAPQAEEPGEDEGDEEEDLFDQLYPYQHRMLVKVTTPTGEPLKQVAITVHPKQLNPCFAIGDGEGRIAVPHKAKRICVEFHGGEGWDLSLGAGMYGPFDATLEEVSIQLEPGIDLVGRVLDPDGQGLQGVRVSILAIDPLREEAPERYEYWYSCFDTRTDKTGRFSIRGLRKGEYGMAIDAPAEIIVPDLKRFILSREEMDVRLRKGIEAEVKVLDDQGKPYAGAEVQARLLEGEGKGRGWEVKSQAYTGRDGVARLIGLDPEKRYRLGVYPDSDLRLDLDRMHVHDWEPTETTVQLERKLAGGSD